MRAVEFIACTASVSGVASPKGAPLLRPSTAHRRRNRFESGARRLYADDRDISGRDRFRHVQEAALSTAQGFFADQHGGNDPFHTRGPSVGSGSLDQGISGVCDLKAAAR